MKAEQTPLDEILQKRRTIRRFSDEEVCDRDVEKIINAANLAPSNGNIQPWYFLIIKDKQTKEDLKKIVNEFYREVLQTLTDRKAVLMRSFYQYAKFKDSPTWIIVFFQKDEYHEHIYKTELFNKLGGRWIEQWKEATKQSVTHAVHNILLKATDLGYYTCILGGFYVLKEKIEEYFDLGEEWGYFTTILLGKKPKDLQIEDIKRKRLEETMSYYPYNREKILVFLEEYTNEKIVKHSLWVEKYALQIYQSIKNFANLCSISLELNRKKRIVLEISSLVHDIGMRYGWKEHYLKSIDIIKEELKKYISPCFFADVIKCVKHHSILNPPTENSSVEEKILYDADKIAYIVESSDPIEIEKRRKKYGNLFLSPSKDLLEIEIKKKQNEQD